MWEGRVVALVRVQKEMERIHKIGLFKGSLMQSYLQNVGMVRRSHRNNMILQDW